MRLFIAINFDDELKDAMEDIQDALWDAGMDGRFTSRENLHLTLAFIGEYGDADRVKEVVEGMTVRPFRIAPEGIGAFGDLWWAGVCSAPELTGLAKRLRRALSDAEIPFDRKRFSPHVTLVRRARLADGGGEVRWGAGSPSGAGGPDGAAGAGQRKGGSQLPEELAEAVAKAGKAGMTVDHISLMRSDRGKNGMIYTEIARSR